MRGELEGFDGVAAGEDGGGVLHVGAQELSEAVLDVGQAGLEVGEGHDDLFRVCDVSLDPFGLLATLFALVVGEIFC